ncbi:MAG: hypothetical protein AAFV85_11160 [Cyanobacteria bacterium J06634_6]
MSVFSCINFHRFENEPLCTTLFLTDGVMTVQVVRGSVSFSSQVQP